MDRALIERAQTGDHAAFGDMVAPHLAVARRVAASVCGETDCDDAVQTSLMRAFKGLSSFDSSREFRPWFLTIVRNEALNSLRSKGRRNAAEQRLMINGVALFAPAAEDSALDAVDREAVVTAVGRLSEIDRVTLETRFLAERSEAETAAVLGVPIGTVKSRSNRALKHLRMVLAAVAIVVGVLAIPPIRKAVAQWLGLRGVRIEQPSTPSHDATVSTTTTTIVATPTTSSALAPNTLAPSKTALSIPVGFGETTTLSHARQRLPFTFSVPRYADLGDPDAVSIDAQVADGIVTLWWQSNRHGSIPTNPTQPAWALAFSAFRGSLETQSLVKILPQGTTVVPIEVNGDSGFWIAGAPHDLFVTTGQGSFSTITNRLATNTLMWQHGDVTYRLEANIDLAAAIAIANTVG